MMCMYAYGDFYLVKKIFINLKIITNLRIAGISELFINNSYSEIWQFYEIFFTNFDKHSLTYILFSKYGYQIASCLLKVNPNKLKAI